MNRVDIEQYEQINNIYLILHKITNKYYYTIEINTRYIKVLNKFGNVLIIIYTGQCGIFYFTLYEQHLETPINLNFTLKLLRKIYKKLEKYCYVNEYIFQNNIISSCNLIKLHKLINFYAITNLYNLLQFYLFVHSVKLNIDGNIYPNWDTLKKYMILNL